MQLKVVAIGPTSVRAGYSCPCDCAPEVDYQRGELLVEEGCCCGNHFAVGPQAGASMSPRSDFRYELQTFAAPWGERLEAAWLVGPSTHSSSGHEARHDHEVGGQDGAAVTREEAIDLVCGMTVDPNLARAKGLHSTYKDTDYFFCGKGCKLDFDEDPEHYLAAGYSPSM